MLRPVLELDDLSFLPLSGDLTPAQVEQVMTRMGEYLDDAVDPLSALLSEDGIVAPGGLLVTDPATGAVVEPGCCCGLESWRSWLNPLTGGQPELGHSPEARVEFRAGVLEVHSAAHPAPVQVDLPAAALPDQLRAVQRDLTAFLALAGNWAPPARAAELTRALDEALRITAPLELPG